MERSWSALTDGNIIYATLRPKEYIAWREF